MTSGKEEDRKPYKLTKEEARALVEAGYMPLTDYLKMFPDTEVTPPSLPQSK
jgi:hypothetical protein